MDFSFYSAEHNGERLWRIKRGIIRNSEVGISKQEFGTLNRELFIFNLIMDLPEQLNFLLITIA
jgi:hypothetical protein